MLRLGEFFSNCKHLLSKHPLELALELCTKTKRFLHVWQEDEKLIYPRQIKRVYIGLA